MDARRRAKARGYPVAWDFIEWVRGEPCAICGRRPPPGGQTDPEHHPPVGRTGIYHDKVWPCCRLHHDMLGTIGRKTFERRFRRELGGSLGECVRRTRERYDARLRAQVALDANGGPFEWGADNQIQEPQDAARPGDGEVRPCPTNNTTAKQSKKRRKRPRRRSAKAN